MFFDCYRVLVIVSILIQYCIALTSTSDYDVLEDLYDSTNGTHWHTELRSNNWNFTGGYTVQNPCGDDWEGITCNATASTCLLADSICVVSVVNLTLYNLTGICIYSFICVV